MIRMILRIAYPNKCSSTRRVIIIISITNKRKHGFAWLLFH